MVRLQQCNILNLPENYSYMYYIYHSTSWPHLLFLAEDGDKVVGYVLAKLEEPEEKDKKLNGPLEAHITSLSVVRTHRKLGIATKLMKVAEYQMEHVYKCNSCSLRVRISNRAAISLYKRVLKYDVLDIDKSYYQDGEDAYDMKKSFGKGSVMPAAIKEEKKVGEAKALASIPEEEKGADAAGDGKNAERNRKKREKAKAKKAAQKSQPSNAAKPTGPNVFGKIEGRGGAAFETMGST